MASRSARVAQIDRTKKAIPTEAARATALKIVKQQYSRAPQALVVEPERTQETLGKLAISVAARSE